MKIQKETLIFNLKTTSLNNLFSNQTSPEYKELFDYLNSYNRPFIFKLYNKQDSSLVNNSINIHRLKIYLKMDNAKDYELKIFSPLIEVAEKHNIDEFIY